MRRGRRDLLAVQPPAVAVACRLELHRCSIRAGLRLAVADGELDIIAQHLRQKLALELLAAVADYRLTDDPDPLPDLRRTASGQAFVHQVLVDAGLPAAT